MSEAEKPEGFSAESVKTYPHAERKLTIEVGPYSLAFSPEGAPATNRQKALTTFISPHGMEIQGTKDYPKGTLLKIAVALPDYWTRKKKFVDYNRIDVPDDFKILAKVVGSQELGKRGKKKLILVQTVNIDEVDEKVLKDFLQEGK